jgi:hypothetical protein
LVLVAIVTSESTTACMLMALAPLIWLWQFQQPHLCLT